MAEEALLEAALNLKTLGEEVSVFPHSTLQAASLWPSPCPSSSFLAWLV